ncbi:hypothetical protein DAEQUDRAFT_677539 [Daedalea quercina L-15889]|uniref:Condensation domain-containing protein n=1 Tax=Daedalea quercina L-15889 TaxID=1314783 RepID=A0A165LYY5_9APHY|nr:hypothetical protein DAEQUDRAFT_677539 [Daedalea quercina L-15889]
MCEPSLTTSRPLSIGEFTYAFVRQGGGMADLAAVLSLECTGGYTVADDAVISACAALRLRHPLLGSSVSFCGTPHFAINSPMTQAHALRTAKDQIEFHTFDDQGKALIALRDQWLAFDPDKALDIRERTCALWWGRDGNPNSGKYLFGLMTTHFVTDARRCLNLVRCFLELLASPGQAQEELDTHFSGQASPVPIPPPTEDLKPKLDGDEDKIRKAKLTFDELVTRYAEKPKSGILPDGSPSAVRIPRVMSRVWSSEDTARILQACKEHGVTITHLVNAAGALSSVHGHDCTTATATDHDDSDAFYFEITQPIDLVTKLPRIAAKFGDMETALRVDTYPIMLCIPRSAVAPTSTPAHIWEIAKQCKERSDGFIKSPHFWHLLSMYGPLHADAYKARLASRPALPFMSSFGDLKALLPSHYTVHTTAATPGYPTSAEIRATDLWTTVRIDPSCLAYHLFTFDSRLHLNFKYNANFTSDALVDPWFNRLLEIVSRAVQG